MSTRLLTAPERSGRTFSAAIRVLGGLGILQVLVVLWAVLIRFDGQEAVRVSAPPPLAWEYAGSVPPSLTQPVPTPRPALPDTSAVPDASLNPVTDGPSISVADLPPLDNLIGSRARIIENPAAEEMVELALKLRARGDTQGALRNLTEAGNLVSNHPRIMAELATTYGQMGLDEKETEFWQRVLDLGLTEGGVYFTYAEEFFAGNLVERDIRADSLLRVADTSVVEDPSPSGGEHYLLTIYLEASEGAFIDPTKMILQVFFYDLVDGTDFDLTIADTRQHLPSEPYNWANGARELVEMEYILPPLQPEQMAQLGSRSYYGYVIKLFYEDVLQDLVAEPRKLGYLNAEGVRETRSSLFPTEG